MRGDRTGERTRSGAAGDRMPASVRIIREFMGRHGIEVLVDGSMQKRSAPRMAMSHADVEACLSIEDIDALWLVDEILLELSTELIKPKKSDLERALRRVVREDQRRRRTPIMRPLLAGIDPLDRARADEEWDRLVGGVFETDQGLATAILRHFVWQVKQKLLRRPVRHHLMPVVSSPIQGSGKTTFVLRFLEPLRELATGPVLLSDFADRRSGDIYGFPAVFVHDMEQIEPALIPVLKSLVIRFPVEEAGWDFRRARPSIG